MDIDRINTYLHFSYLPNQGRGAYPFDAGDVRKAAVGAGSMEPSDEDLGRVWDRALDRNIGRCVQKEHAIPLSGGLDSRSILAGLLEKLDRREILTITRGVPGTLDFEIGRAVAAKAGVRHEAFDLSAIVISMEGLIESIRAGYAWTYTLNGFFNHQALRSLGTQCNMWTGFMGGAVGGSHSKVIISDEHALDELARAYKFSRNVNLVQKAFDPKTALASPENMNLNYSRYELIDFANHQSACLRAVNFACRQDVLAPFTDPEWIAVMGRVRSEERQGCVAYHGAMLKRFPKLMSLPCKNNAGLPLKASKWRRARHSLVSRINRTFLRRSGTWVIDPKTNHVPYAEAFRMKPDFRNLVQDAISHLESESIVPWLDCRKIAEDHLNAQADNHQALQVLIGLSANLLAERSRLPAGLNRTEIPKDAAPAN